MTAPMTIPDEAVQAASKRIDDYYDTPNCVGETAMRAALKAALPSLQGVKVKALEWSNSDELRNDEWLCSTETLPSYSIMRWWLDDVREQVGHFEVEGLGEDQFGTLEAAKAAAQANYEARILSEIELSGNPGQLTPSPRAQALEGGRLWDNAQAEELAIGWTYDFSEIERICDDAAKQCGYDATLEFTEAVMKIADARFVALSSMPVADGWLPIETAPKDGTWVMAFYRKECVPAVVFYDEDTSRWCGQDIGENSFTHWRPLPASPGASE